MTPSARTPTIKETRCTSVAHRGLQPVGFLGAIPGFEPLSLANIPAGLRVAHRRPFRGWNEGVSRKRDRDAGSDPSPVNDASQTTGSLASSQTDDPGEGTSAGTRWDPRQQSPTLAGPWNSCLCSND